MNSNALESSNVMWVESSPLGKSWKKLMIWLFVIGDALLFAGFLSAYGFIRIASPTWPHTVEIFSSSLLALMTAILLTTGATMASAVQEARNQTWAKVVRFLILTMVGGGIFLGLQAYEWTKFIHEGATLTGNPWGVPLFSACFFMITGFHGVHVLSGLLLLGITAIRSHFGKSQVEGLEILGIYWAFVDLVWVFIFPLFYLI